MEETPTTRAILVQLSNTRTRIKVTANMPSLRITEPGKVEVQHMHRDITEYALQLVLYWAAEEWR
jgi:hypothetical protein